MMKHVNDVAAVMQESESIAEDSGTEAGSVVEGQFSRVYICNNGNLCSPQ